MKHVEISTSNHVSIEYELATVTQRIVSTIIDMMIIFIWLFVSGIISDIGGGTSTSRMVWMIALSIPFFTYSLIAEAFFNGQTVGKKIMAIKVVKMNGKNPELAEATIRWAFRWIDIWGSAGVLAFLLTSSTEKSQRLGDRLANTTVINVKPKDVYSIEDILSIKDTSKYTPKYPQVVQYTDNDMLLLKNALDRSKRYPTKNHKALLSELGKKIRTQLDIKKGKKLSEEKFLRTVLQDYIVLTRS